MHLSRLSHRYKSAPYTPRQVCRADTQLLETFLLQFFLVRNQRDIFFHLYRGQKMSRLKSFKINDLRE